MWEEINKLFTVTTTLFPLVASPGLTRSPQSVRKARQLNEKMNWDDVPPKCWLRLMVPLMPGRFPDGACQHRLPVQWAPPLGVPLPLHGFGITCLQGPLKPGRLQSALPLVSLRPPLCSIFQQSSCLEGTQSRCSWGRATPPPLRLGCQKDKPSQTCGSWAL